MMMSCLMQRAAVRAVARKRKEEAANTNEGGDVTEGENWESVEPMEVLEGGGASDGGDKFSELDQYSAENPNALR